MTIRQRVCVSVCVCVSHVATVSGRRSMTIRRRVCVCACVCFSCRYCFRKEEYDYQATCVCECVCVFLMSLLFQEGGVWLSGNVRACVRVCVSHVATVSGRRSMTIRQRACMCADMCVRVCVSHVATVSGRRSMTIRQRACVSVCVCVSHVATVSGRRSMTIRRRACVCACVCVCVFLMSLLFQEGGV